MLLIKIEFYYPFLVHNNDYYVLKLDNKEMLKMKGFTPKLHKKIETKIIEIGEERATLYIINYYSDTGTISYYKGVLVSNCLVVELKPCTYHGYIVDTAKDIFSDIIRGIPKEKWFSKKLTI